MNYTEHEGRRFYNPTPIQMRSVVRGSDRMPRPKFSPLVLLLSVSLMIGAICGLVWMAITQ